MVYENLANTHNKQIQSDVLIYILPWQEDALLQLLASHWCTT